MSRKRMHECLDWVETNAEELADQSKNPTRRSRNQIDERRLAIGELLMSLSAVVACLLRRSNNGYEGRVGHYGEVGSLYRFL